jgi:hypothetical protein
MHASLRIVTAAGLLLAIVAPLTAQSKLSQQIDRLIQEKLDQAKVPASPLADDAEFLRRVHLDLTGRLPTYEQTTAFLDSKDADRRAKLIDELLSRPEYGLHFATLWREADADPTEFSHGVPQFLLLMNGNASANPQNLGKLTTGKSKEEAVRALYLAVLSRPPRAAETQRMLAHVEKAPTPAQGYRDVYWVLLNSAEFVLNR